MASPHVMIIGAGIGGLSLAVFLEAAGIDYTVYERAEKFEPVGGAITLSAQVLRVFDQLGMLAELQKIGISFVATRYYRQNLSVLGRADLCRYEQKFGYHSIFFARSDLIEYLLSKVPAHKVQWNKRVLSIEQNRDWVMIRTSDGSFHHGDIVVGSDGAHSTIRQLLFEAMEEQGLEVPESDKESTQPDQFAIVGVTKDLHNELPAELNKAGGTLNVVLATSTQQQALNVYTTPLPGNRIGWMVSGSIPLLQMDNSESANLGASDWESGPVDKLRKQMDNIKLVVGGSVETLINNTTQTCQVGLKDKFVRTWYYNRTCLMGDAVHKVQPAGGQGGNQAILDAICLANLISERQPSDPQDITTVFERYYELRARHAKGVVEGSEQLHKIMTTQGKMSGLKRRVLFNLPAWTTVASDEQIYGGRPLLTFVDPIPLKGQVKNKMPDLSFGDKTNKTSKSRQTAVLG